MMLNLSKEKKIIALSSLGSFLKNPDEEFIGLINASQHSNGWFTPNEIRKACSSIGNMLTKEDLLIWIPEIPESNKTLNVGLVLAGNIPLVGFHDILSVLVSSHTAVIKLSSQDDKLLPGLLNKLFKLEPAFKNQVRIVQKLENFDAVIATGSNNTSRYFEYYFGKVPHIIRKNRNSIAVISGNESKEQLAALGKDIFDYFGLGCRSVSKLMVPSGYNFIPFFESIESYQSIFNHHKYNNNYDYNKSILLVNKVKHLDNGFLLLTESEKLTSPLAVLHWQSYENQAQLEHLINMQEDMIQVVVTEQYLKIKATQVKFGESQYPKLWDYADGVNTIDFLTNI